MQELLGSALDDLESAQARQLMQRTVRAWEDADLGELDRYDQWCECLKTPPERKLMKRLLDDRNPVLAQRIDEIHAAGSTLFAAVGAMHMAGPNGIPALLERRGYKVTRLR